MNHDLSVFDALRTAQGMMTVSEITKLVEQGNTIFDPFSVLISSSVQIGTGNTIHPCVSIIASDDASLVIGDGNAFYPNCSFLAEGAAIEIGSDNQFGEGGFTAKANRPGVCISIADDGRYIGGASVFGNTHLGDGCQLIGAISVDSCKLEGGNSWRHSDADMRGALLKGFGTARYISIKRGQVIDGRWMFSVEEIKPQSFFHLKESTRS